jgi:hypothetical protein
LTKNARASIPPYPVTESPRAPPIQGADDQQIQSANDPVELMRDINALPAAIKTRNERDKRGPSGDGLNRKN